MIVVDLLKEYKFSARSLYDLSKIPAKSCLDFAKILPFLPASCQDLAVTLPKSYQDLAKIVPISWHDCGGGILAPGEVLGSSFAEHVPLASQNPYPIIVYFWSILWPIIIIINPILVTFGQIIFLLSKSRKSATLF